MCLIYKTIQSCCFYISKIPFSYRQIANCLTFYEMRECDAAVCDYFDAHAQNIYLRFIIRWLRVGLSQLNTIAVSV